jgi:hypothetical protein
MVLLERETSDTLFETLADWNQVLEAEDFRELERKCMLPELRGPRP